MFVNVLFKVDYVDLTVLGKKYLIYHLKCLPKQKHKLSINHVPAKSIFGHQTGCTLKGDAMTSGLDNRS